ncbi:MAG: histidine kinase [Parvularculaceae bacterium]|nr:histidine kinase [Parvularculaceae bacterium]
MTTEPQNLNFMGRRLSLAPNQYWTFQLGGWLAFAALSYFSLTIWYNPGQFTPAFHTLLQSLIGILVSHPLRWIARSVWTKNVLTRAGVNIAAAIAASFIWTIVRILTFTWLTGEVIDAEDWGGWIFGSVIVFSAWSISYHALVYYRLLAEQREVAIVAERRALEAREKAREERLKRIEAEKLSQAAELRMLKYQLKPHFLFNALNSVTALVQSGSREDATKMLARIGDFLRLSLEEDDSPVYTLEDELTMNGLYLDIERARFGDRLTTEFAVSDDSLSALVPKLLLQPVVENIMKHAVSKTLSQVHVLIKAATSSRMLTITIENTPARSEEGSSPQSVAPSLGIGLANVRERLQSMYTDQYRFDASETSDGGWRVELTFPDSVNTD